MKTPPSKKLDRFPNPARKPYAIRFECPEFTCLCPKTGQPDFATIRIAYVPNKFCVELKSLKLYLWSFRNEGHFHEAVTNRICDDLVRLLKPKWIEVVGDFFVRGGIKTVVTVTRGKYVEPHGQARGPRCCARWAEPRQSITRLRSFGATPRLPAAFIHG